MRRFVASPHILLVLLVPLLVPGLLAAQEASIRGSVLDERGDPIPGAAVVARGTQASAVVDAEGQYLLSVPPGTYELEASSLGYRSSIQSVTVGAGGTATVDFTLGVSAIQLGQVVASVEAGEVTRRQLGTDIASIDVAESVPTAVVSNVSELLNARAPNVTVTQGSGNIGAGSRIRIRGVNSLTQGNNPLIIIDGVRASNDTETGINRGQTFSRFDDLDPANIARIQVVKGPAALALYGSEAASGVIIVETKNGRGAAGGDMQFSLQVQQGSMWDVTEYPDNLADVTQFVTGASDPLLDGWETETHPMTGQVFVVDNPYEDLDSSPFRRGRMSSASIQVSGNADEISYFTSLAHDNQLGTLPSNDLRRTNFRANFRATPNEKISVSASSGYIRSTINLPKSGNNTSGFFTNALTGIPLSSRNAEGECLATVLAGVESDFCDKNGNRRAAFDKIAAIISREKVERFTGSLQVDYTPLSWLTNSAVLGTDIVDQVFNDAIPYDPDIPFSFAAGGEFFRTRNLFRNLTVDLSSRASYNLTSSLNARTGIGAQYFQNTREEIACEGRDFVNDQATACDAGVSLRGFSDLLEKVEIGAYVQQHVGYNDYLFLNGALRVDDNSALGVNESEIWSPSVNGSLVVSSLPMWNVDPEMVSDLRLRAAWGTATQSPIQYAADRTYGIVRLGTDAGIVSGLSPEDPGNPDLGPERSSEIEAGLDAGVLNDRIGLQFTYFNRTTRDAIVLRPVAPSTGFADNQWVNLGELENKGYEASINALLLDRDDLTWDVVLTLASTKATIVDLGDQDGFAGFYEGYAPGSLTSCVITSATRTADGEIINDAGELVGTVEHLPGTIDEGCERVVGQVTPTNEQSLFTTLRLFDNFEISALFDRAAGHLLGSGTMDGHEPGSLDDINSRFGRMWAYRQLRSSAIEQAYMELDFYEGDHNAIWYQPADFIKFRELKVNYHVPAEFAGGFGMNNATLYAGARNLVTWTDYEGIDPEINGRGARDEIFTEEEGALAPPLMFFTGLRVTF